MVAQMLSVEAVAESLTVDPQKVYHWIRNGELSAVNTSREANPKRPRWRIPAESLAAFIQARTVARAAPPDPRKHRRNYPTLTND